MKMERIEDAVKKAGRDILLSAHHKQTKYDIQHGNMSVRQHTINVPICSMLISEKLGISCDKKALVRGALLHDYFLYDWHDKEHKHRRPHGFFHASAALRNAMRDFTLTDIEKDIIKKHMWPLTVVPPVYREAWIVSIADKYCSFMETVRLHRKHYRRRQNG